MTTTSSSDEMITAAAIISELQFLQWLDTARPGESFVYHLGVLARDRENDAKIDCVGTRGLGRTSSRQGSIESAQSRAGLLRICGNKEGVGVMAAINSTGNGKVTVQKKERNAQVWKWRQAGFKLAEIAQEFGFSESRAWLIVEQERCRRGLPPSKLRARRLTEQERAEARVRARTPRPTDERLLRDIKLPLRAINVLRGEGVHTIGDLTWMTETQLLRLPHVGRITLWDIQQALEMMGLSLRRDPNRRGKRTLAIPRSWAVTVRNQVRVCRAAEHKAAKEAAASNRKRAWAARKATRAADSRERAQRRERAVAARKATIWARLQEGATSQEVAAEFGITRVRVNQVRRETDRQRGLPNRGERYRDRIGAITKLARAGKRESEIIADLGEPERLVGKVMRRAGIDPWEIRRKRTTKRFAKVRSLRKQGVPFKTIAGLLGITIQRARTIDMSERRRLGVVSGHRKPGRDARILALAHAGIGRAEIAREVGATYNIVKLVIKRAKRKAVTSAAEGNLSRAGGACKGEGTTNEQAKG